VPDRGPDLSPIRTPSRKSVSRKSAKFTIVIASSAMAMAAVAVGTAAALPASPAARPAIAAAASQPAQAAAAPELRTLSFGTGGNASLGGSAQPYLQARSFQQAQSYQQAQGAVALTSSAVLSATLSSTSHGRLTPRQIARKLLRSFRWSWRQFKYLNWLWDRESSWNVYAANPYSGAYGIPQALPGSKMASAGSNWRTSARTQIRWGLGYIRAVYGSPRRAWDHELAVGWY
jgi:hypothetical protein